MDAMRHAHLARLLIAACGGLAPSAAACRLERSRLSEFQDAHTAAFMPADVIADLEMYCGEPLYSRAIAENRPSATQAADVLTEACEVTESAGALLRTARLAAGDGRLTAQEKAAIEQGVLAIEGQLRELRAAASGQGAET